MSAPMGDKAMKMLRPCLLVLPLLALSGCATMGSVMSPYSEKFSCKNSDHGQCIHPGQAYADAVAGRASRSDPAVTHDRKLLAPDKKRARGSDMAPAKAAATPPALAEGSGRVRHLLASRTRPVERR